MLIFALLMENSMFHGTIAIWAFCIPIIVNTIFHKENNGYNTMSTNQEIIIKGNILAEQI